MRGWSVLLVLPLLAGCTVTDEPVLADALVVGAVLDVTVDTVWEGVAFRPEGDGIRPAAEVHVAHGATLTVRDSDLSQVRIVVDGGLLWSGGGLTLGAGPVVVRGDATFERTDLHGSPAELLRIEGGRVRLEDTGLGDAGGDGVRVDGGSLHALGGSWSGIVGYGVFARDGDVVLEGVRALDTLEYGVRAEGGTLTVRDGAFAQECGIYVRGGRAMVSNTTLDTSGHGVTAFDADVRLADVTLRGARAALLLSNATARLDRVDVAGVAVAVEAVASRVTVDASRVGADEVGIRLRGGSLHLGASDVVGPGLGVHAREAAVHAPDVWWGGDPPVVGVEGFERTTWRSTPATGY